MNEKIFARQIKVVGEKGGTLYYLFEDNTGLSVGKIQFDGFTVPETPKHLIYIGEYNELFPTFKVTK
jgi:hypothetical protein